MYKKIYRQRGVAAKRGRRSISVERHRSNDAVACGKIADFGAGSAAETKGAGR